MQVHAKDKPIPREGDAVWESDALLHRTAELTIGMAGADLANLLNEASILMACPTHPLWLCPPLFSLTSVRLLQQTCRSLSARACLSLDFSFTS